MSKEENKNTPGRTSKYGEETRLLGKRVPVSKYDFICEVVQAISEGKEVVILPSKNTYINDIISNLKTTDVELVAINKPVGHGITDTLSLPIKIKKQVVSKMEIPEPKIKRSDTCGCTLVGNLLMRGKDKVKCLLNKQQHDFK